MDRPQAACRECRTLLKGTTYLQLGTGSKLCLQCIDCIDRHFAKDLGGYKSLGEFVSKYLLTIKPQNEVLALKKRVEELERLLDGYAKP